MGSYSPVQTVDAARAAEICAAVHQPVLDELARRGIPFHGVLYAGLMTISGGAGGIRVLEFNVRFGDPETQAILPRLPTALFELLLAATRPGGLAALSAPRWDERAAVTLVLASAGYPETSSMGDPITGTELVAPEVALTHAGTARDEDGRLVTAGGRVLSLTALGEDLAAARIGAYAGARAISFPGRQLRSDIALGAAG